MGEGREGTMKVINLTPHAVNLLKETESGKETIAVYEPSGLLARVSAGAERMGMMGNIPISKTIFGKACLVDSNKQKHPLPVLQADIIYIVSAMVAKACNRPDFYIVNETVRDEDGRIIGCQSFAQVD